MVGMLSRRVWGEGESEGESEGEKKRGRSMEV